MLDRDLACARARRTARRTHRARAQNGAQNFTKSSRHGCFPCHLRCSVHVRGLPASDAAALPPAVIERFTDNHLIELLM